ncbi:lysophospholipid acyltransferase family protein [Solimonas terrae]|uniref:1-acyl-sn-glycerol-3-phosphate acyltransferase n=1 Tax=Solimonas terrae TaxID=1396819 RepID=A0A6M2BN89_9GAMM|nr:lysophospholipid acyltransferase family protein [Solimonas terrae]NGY03854.1 1-acyl-sn-glycerol-3-phosphate acyltransferase [Solimonas terrae]
MRRLLDLIYAPLAALALALLIPPVCIAVIIGPTLTIRRETGRFCVRLMMACIGVPLRVRGIGNLPAGAAIVVCNHASYVDGIVLTAALPRRYSFVVQDGAAGWPLVGQCLTRMGVIYVNRRDARAGARTTRALMHKLGANEPLAIFAEGTFKPEPGLLPFKVGAFMMAARCDVPVVPAAIRGSRRLYGGGRRLPRWSRLEIEIGRPLHPIGKDRDAALVLRAEARDAVLQLSGEPERLDIADADRED